MSDASQIALMLESSASMGDRREIGRLQSHLNSLNDQEAWMGAYKHLAALVLTQEAMSQAWAEAATQFNLALHQAPNSHLARFQPSRLNAWLDDLAKCAWVPMSNAAGDPSRMVLVAAGQNSYEASITLLGHDVVLKKQDKKRSYHLSPEQSLDLHQRIQPIVAPELSDEVLVTTAVNAWHHRRSEVKNGLRAEQEALERTLASRPSPSKRRVSL